MGPKQRSHFVRVVFRVVLKEVQIGDHVRVVGGDTALGNWNPEDALSLWAFAETDCWVSEEVQLPLKKLVEYKYAVCENGTGKIRYWEDFEGNRSMTPTGVLHVVEDDNGLYRTLAREGDFPCAQQRQNKGVVSDKFTRKLSDLGKLKTAEFGGTLFVVSIHLPMSVTRQEDGSYQVAEAYNKCSTTVALLHQDRNKRKDEAPRPGSNIMCRRGLKFVGWPHCFSPESDDERRKIEKLLQEYDCIPVFLNESVFMKFNRFCQEYLWPSFHNVSVFTPQSQSCRGSKVTEFPKQDWEAYKSANALFAAATVEKCFSGDVIVAQDYHLLLLPKYSATSRPEGVKAGLHLHTPWPGSNVFLKLPVREEILKCLLCADLLAFQFFEYTRNFLTVAYRLLKLEPVFRMGGVLVLEYNNRSLTLRSQHVVIPYDHVLWACKLPAVRTKTEELRALVGKKTIFASIDRCDRFAGIGLKLEAFDNLLRHYPQHRGNCVLVQYVLSPRTAFEDNHVLQEQLQEKVDSINNTYGYHIFFKVADFENADRYSVLEAADVYLDTSIKDGLNVIPFEYLATHAVDEQGIVIVSEFTGCSRALMGALRVNPWSTTGVCHKLDTALTMQSSERKERFMIDHSYVSKHDLIHWLDEIGSDIRVSNRVEEREDNLPVPRGFAQKFSVMEWHCCTLLDTELTIQKYHAAKQRVIFCDHDGTLVLKTSATHNSTPPAKLLQVLASICRDPNTHVVIVSGRGTQTLQACYGKIDGLWICAEHGYYMAQMPLDEEKGWECIVDQAAKANEGWQAIAGALMEHYVKRTQGSIIEHKGSCVTWNYLGSEMEFGNLQGQKLTESLVSLLQSYQCEVASGIGYVEVKVRGVNKGVAVNKLLERFGDVDFVLCVGDDRSDEEMFNQIHQRFDPLVKNLLVPKKRLSEGLKGLQRGWTTPDPSPSHSAMSYSDGGNSCCSSPRTPKSHGSPDPPEKQERERSPKKGRNSTGSILSNSEVMRKISLTPDGSPRHRGSMGPKACPPGSPRKVDLFTLGPYIVTATVGLKPTSARNYLQDVSVVQALFRGFESKHKLKTILSVPVICDLAS